MTGEGLGSGEFQAGVAGLRVRVNYCFCLKKKKKNKLVPLARKMLSESSLKIVLAGIFQFDISVTKDNLNQSIEHLTSHRSSGTSDLWETPLFVFPGTSIPCWHLVPAGIRLVAFPHFSSFWAKARSVATRKNAN